MTLLVVGTDGAVARALRDDAPPATAADAAAAVERERPSQLAIIALPASAGPVGALADDAFAALIDATVTCALAAATAAARLGLPMRIAIVTSSDGVLPDHLDGARSVAAAGLAMLAEVAAAADGLTANAIAVADDVPVAEVAAVVRFALSDEAPSLNGATIRLDGGRDAVLAAETRTEGD